MNFIEFPEQLLGPLGALIISVLVSITFWKKCEEITQKLIDSYQTTIDAYKKALDDCHARCDAMFNELMKRGD